MTLTVTHSVVATGSNDGSKQVSKNAWNDDHVLTGDYLRKATVTLSSADILDLHNTPVVLVPAPGTGKWLVPWRVVSGFAYGTAAYTASAAAEVNLDWLGSDVYPGRVTNDITVGGDRAYHQSIVGDDLLDPTLVEDIPLVARSSDTSVYSDGDGTLTVTVWYSIEDVP